MDQLNDNKGHSVNMNISIPIFNRNQTKAQVKIQNSGRNNQFSS